MLKESFQDGICPKEGKFSEDKGEGSMLLSVQSWQVLGWKKAILPKEVSEENIAIDAKGFIVRINSWFDYFLLYLGKFVSFLVYLLNDIKKDKVKGALFSILLVAEIKLDQFRLSFFIPCLFLLQQTGQGLLEVMIFFLEIAHLMRKVIVVLINTPQPKLFEL